MLMLAACVYGRKCPARRFACQHVGCSVIIWHVAVGAVPCVAAVFDVAAQAAHAD